MQGDRINSIKKRASTPNYVSPNQLTLCGFETPFEQQLTTQKSLGKNGQVYSLGQDSTAL